MDNITPQNNTGLHKPKTFWHIVVYCVKKCITFAFVILPNKIMPTTKSTPVTANTGYHVRTLVSPETQQHLYLEQSRRLVATGERVSLMDIAAEWLTEAGKRAQQCAG